MTLRHKLNPKEIDSLPPGTHGDGNNLYVVVKDTGARSYLLRYQWNGRPQKMGLGSTRELTLAAARDRAIDANRLIDKGTNPRETRDEARQAAAPAILFGEFAEAYRQRIEQGFKAEKHKAKWKYNIQIRFKPLHRKRIDQITSTDIVELLMPIWLKYPVAARDARQQLEAVLSAAKAAGHRKGDNPAAWRDNLQHLMPKTKRKGRVRGPQKALPFEELPALMAALARVDTVSARMLETCILTASRTVEIRNMKWSDIDLDRALWRVPAKLMKLEKEHVVPLSRPVMSFLRSAHEVRFGDYVFPGRVRGEPMSDMTMLKLLQRDMGHPGITVHGTARACFRTWADEVTSFSNQAVEFCLAHVPGDEAEKAYRRGSMLKKREQIMAAWATFATKPPVKIVSIDDKRAA